MISIKRWELQQKREFQFLLKLSLILAPVEFSKKTLTSPIKNKKADIQHIDFFMLASALNIGSGNDLSSREATLRVLSAMKVFTTVFGMGTGGVLLLCHR